MRRRIGDIINALKGAIQDNDLKVSDDVLLHEAMTTFRGLIANRGQTVSTHSTEVIPPTEKQLSFLKKNHKRMTDAGFDVDAIKDKKVASDIISAFLDLQKKPKPVPQEVDTDELYSEEDMLL